MPVWMLQHFPSQTAKTLIEALAVLQRFAFSLAAVSEKSFETLQNEPVEVSETLARIANGKVLPPASTEPVDLFQRIPQRSFEPAFGECPDFVLESLHRFAGWKEIKISLAVRPYRSRSYRRVNPRKSKLSLGLRIRTTLVFLD